MDAIAQFRQTHGDYTTWTNEQYDLYFALIADQATHLTEQLTTPTTQPTA
ncbi:hypothetical protein ACPCTG_31810 [Streptomyces pseudogriseolus]